MGGRVAMLYYRKDVFQAAKIQPPNTWSDLLYLAKALNGSDVDQGMVLVLPVECY